MLWKDKEFVCNGCGCNFSKENACATNVPKYCSLVCYRKDTEKTIASCVICQKEFYQIMQGKKEQKTCSRDCGYTLRGQQPNKKKGGTYPHLQRAKIKKCRTCNKDFRAINDKHNRQQVYCTHRCYVKGNRISVFEDSVFIFLSKYSIEIERQISVGRWAFDFRIKNTNILIEADGSYWHSLAKSKERDLRKNKWCLDNGLELYRIDELSFYKSKKKACQVIINRMIKLDPNLKVKINGIPYEPKTEKVPF